MRTVAPRLLSPGLIHVDVIAEGNTQYCKAIILQLKKERGRENTGVGCIFLLGIFPSQASNPCLLHLSYTGRLILQHWATWKPELMQYLTSIIRCSINILSWVKGVVDLLVETSDRLCVSNKWFTPSEISLCATSLLSTSRKLYLKIGKVLNISSIFSSDVLPVNKPFKYLEGAHSVN